MSKQQDLINELKKALAERSTTTTPKITTAIPNTNAVTIPANAKNTTATIAKDDKLKLLEIAIENFKQDLKKIKTTDNHGKIKSMLFYATGMFAHKKPPNGKRVGEIVEEYKILIESLGIKEDKLSGVKEADDQDELVCLILSTYDITGDNKAGYAVTRKANCPVKFGEDEVDATIDVSGDVPLDESSDQEKIRWFEAKIKSLADSNDKTIKEGYSKKLANLKSSQLTQEQQDVKKLQDFNERNKALRERALQYLRDKYSNINDPQKKRIYDKLLESLSKEDGLIRLTMISDELVKSKDQYIRGDEDYTDSFNKKGGYNAAKKRTGNIAIIDNIAMLVNDMTKGINVSQTKQLLMEFYLGSKISGEITDQYKTVKIATNNTLTKVVSEDVNSEVLSKVRTIYGNSERLLNYKKTLATSALSEIIKLGFYPENTDFEVCDDNDKYQSLHKDLDKVIAVIEGKDKLKGENLKKIIYDLYTPGSKINRDQIIQIVSNALLNSFFDGDIEKFFKQIASNNELCSVLKIEPMLLDTPAILDGARGLVEQKEIIDLTTRLDEDKSTLRKYISAFRKKYSNEECFKLALNPVLESDSAKAAICDRIGDEHKIKAMIDAMFGDELSMPENTEVVCDITSNEVDIVTSKVSTEQKTREYISTVKKEQEDLAEILRIINDARQGEDSAKLKARIQKELGDSKSSLINIIDAKQRAIMIVCARQQKHYDQDDSYKGLKTLFEFLQRDNHQLLLAENSIDVHNLPITKIKVVDDAFNKYIIDIRNSVSIIGLPVTPITKALGSPITVTANISPDYASNTPATITDATFISKAIRGGGKLKLEGGDGNKKQFNSGDIKQLIEYTIDSQKSSNEKKVYNKTLNSSEFKNISFDFSDLDKSDIKLFFNLISGSNFTNCDFVGMPEGIIFDNKEGGGMKVKSGYIFGFSGCCHYKSRDTSQAVEIKGKPSTSTMSTVARPLVLSTKAPTIGTTTM